MIAARHAQFNYRVAGVCVHDGHALLTRVEPDDYWILPGGRPELLETSRDALLREMQEELGLTVEIGRFLWVVENFFPWEGAWGHELTFYYQMTLPDGSGYDDVQAELTGVEGDILFIFRWFLIDQLATVPLYPTFLRTALADLPASPVHLVHTDPRE